MNRNTAFLSSAWLWGTLVALVALVAGTYYFAIPPAQAARQPIAFNHQVHVKLLNCDFCHAYYATREVAGRPSLTRCMLCHTYPVTDNPKAKAVNAFADKGQPIPWIRMTRVKPFVRFSHQRHVVVGQVACRKCHGPIAKATAPPARPLVPISMQFCLDCHVSKAQRLAGNAAEALADSHLDADLLDALHQLRRTRFTSGDELLAALRQRTGRLPPAPAQQRIVGQLVPAPPVTTDCFACHR